MVSQLLIVDAVTPDAASFSSSLSSSSIPPCFFPESSPYSSSSSSSSQLLLSRTPSDSDAVLFPYIKELLLLGAKTWNEEWLLSWHQMIRVLKRCLPAFEDELELIMVSSLSLSLFLLFLFRFFSCFPPLFAVCRIPRRAGADHGLTFSRCACLPLAY